MATAQELALQMIGQLRVLDPSVSAEVGTPERKIIDTVAQAIAENQIDLNLLNGAFDLDAKFGADLDRLLAIFGFGRQQGVAATGFIKFSRTTTSVYDIPIPANTQVVAPAIQIGNTTLRVPFVTTTGVTLRAGDLSVVAPIRALNVGTQGNVAANTITAFGNTPVSGIPATGITNELPTVGGVDAESDDEFKVRFKNTVFRNLSGTHDQFLALAVATQYTTKANVVGPISRYREYIQVPDVDDSEADPSTSVTGNGAAGDWTSALSTLPYSKHTYDTVPHFISNGESGTTAIFYRQDVDYVMNSQNPLKDKGDTYRGRITGEGLDVTSDDTTTYQPNVTFLNVYEGTDDDVQAVRPGAVLLFEHSYMSSSSRNDYDRAVLNCVDVFINGENAVAADVVIPRPTGTRNLFNASVGDRYYIENYRRLGEAAHRPTLGNIYTPLYFQPSLDLPDTINTSDATFIKGVHYWAIEDVSEIGGTVRARNGIEWATGIPGKINSDPAEGPFTGPKITGTADDAISIQGYFYDRNVADLQVACESNKQVTTDVLAHRATTRRFRLDLTIMYSAGASVAATNAAIETAVRNFLAGQYFGATIQLSDLLQVVHDVAGVDNVRWSRDLIEARAVRTKAIGVTTTSSAAIGATLLNVAALTDPLPAEAELRFPNNVIAVTTAAAAVGATNLSVEELTGAIDADAVGVYDDVLVDAQGFARDRVTECDSNGTPLLNVIVNRHTYGTPSNVEIQHLYVVGEPSGGTYILRYDADSEELAYNASAGDVQTALRSITGDGALTVTGSGTATDPFIATWSSNGYQDLVSATPKLTGGTATFNSDFFLKDDELPNLPTATQDGDSRPGLILRARAQNTWNQL